MTTERIDIIVNEKGSRTVKRNISDIGGAANKSSRGVKLLTRSLGAMGAALGVRELTKYLDVQTSLKNRLRAVGLEGQNLTSVYKDLLGVANDTRSAFDSSIELYSRLALSTKDLNTSSAELIDFTKSLNQAIILSGASSQEASAGLLQLSQGMASGVLRGDELRSVLEQLPAVADVIAKSLGVTRGELRAMGEAGEITAEVILDAFEGAREELADRFGKSIPTIGQSMQVLKNNAVTLFGSFGEGSGIAEGLSKAVLLLANNLETVAKAAIGAASGLVLVGGTAPAIGLVTGAVRGLTAAIAANPFGFLLVVLTSVLSTLFLFSDQISAGIDSVTTMGDVLSVVGGQISGVFGEAVKDLARTVGPIFAGISEGFAMMGASAIGSVSAVSISMSGIVGIINGTFRGVLALFNGLPAAFDDLIARIINIPLITKTTNAALKVLTRFYNGFYGLTNIARKAVGLPLIEKVDFKITGEHEGAAKSLGEKVGTAFWSGYDDSSLGFKGIVDDIKAQAAALAGTREAAKDDKPSPGGGGGSRGGLSPSHRDELAGELDGLVSQYDGVTAAVWEYEAALSILNRAEQAGFVDSTRRAELMALVSDQLADSIDPMRALNDELARESELLKMTADQRDISNQLRDIDLDKRSQGIILSGEELDQIRGKLEILQEEARMSSIRDSILSLSVDKQRELNETLAVYEDLVATKQISEADFALGLRDLAQAQRDLKIELGDASFADGFLTGIDHMTAGVNDFTAETGLVFSDYFNSISNGFSMAIGRAVVFGDSIRDVLGNVAQRALTQMVAGLVQVGIQLLLNKTLLDSTNSSKNDPTKNAIKQVAAIGVTSAAAIQAQTAIASASMAEAAAMLAVWTPVASAVSLASFGANAAPAIAGIAATTVAANAAMLPKYAFGGQFEVGGTGGTDSELVAFRATPGERVAISTPQQDRDESRQAAGQPQGGSVTVLNLLDPALVGDYLATPDGEELLINTISNNAGSIKQALA